MLTVRIVDDFLEEERIEQCFEEVSQWQKEGKGIPSRGISMCKGMEDREGLVRLESSFG